MSELYRAEIISNQSVQEDIIERLEREIPSIQYTVIPEISGRGVRTKKLGDTVWPEMNFVLTAYVSPKAAESVEACVNQVKQKFPREGINLFVL